MKTAVMFEVLVDLVLEDVLNGGHLFEANPNRDTAGRFASKDASLFYRNGVMAALNQKGFVNQVRGLLGAVPRRWRYQ